jgi:nicotinic acid mononucleotide adenylyltransferase
MSNIVFTFLRANPITTGHLKVVDKVLNLASKNDAENLIFLSHTHNSKTDPLEWDYKIKLAKIIFKDATISEDEILNPYSALEFLSNYSNVTFVIGSDRSSKFSSMHKYAAEYGIKNFNIVSIERKYGSRGVIGMTATMARNYAIMNQKKLFYKCIPDILSDRKKNEVFNKVRQTLSR